MHNSAMFSTSTVDTIFGGFLTSVSDVLTNNLGDVLLIVGALIGLGLVIRFVKRHIGKKA